MSVWRFRAFCFRFCVAVMMLALLVSCSSSLPAPLPSDQRIQIVFEPLQDVTGDYTPSSASLEALSALKLRDDYAHRLLKKGYPVRTYTEFVTNQFAEAPEGIEPMTVVNANGPILRLTGTIEQIVYGRPDDVDDYISDTWMQGVWELLESSDDDQAAFVEYNIHVDDARSNNRLTTLLVQGGYRQAGTDRAHIVELANRVATEALVYQLNKVVAPMLGRNPKTEIWEGVHIDEYTSTIRKPGEMD